jgi:hypothetical protein
MKEEIKNRIIKILKDDLGNAADNLARAKAAFNGYSTEMLDRKYGQSSQSCREILNDYQDWYNETAEAIVEIDTL